MRDLETLQDFLNGARMPDEALDGAADDLADRLAGLGRDVRTARRRIAAAPTAHEGN